MMVQIEPITTWSGLADRRHEMSMPAPAYASRPAPVQQLCQIAHWSVNDHPVAVPP